MSRIQGNARALGTVLTTVGSPKPVPRMLLHRPEAKGRVATVDAMTPARSDAALLASAEWTALKRIGAAR
jgi:hypothetical protein